MLHGSVPLRAVLFDLDGTLADTEREQAKAMARALTRHQGIEISADPCEIVVGHSWVEIYRRVKAEHPELSWSRQELIDAAVREREAMIAESGVTPMTGAHAAVERFAHLPRAVVTGSSRAESRQSLRGMGIFDAFNFVYAAEDVPTSKPDPEGYLMAARTLGVDPADCLVVEDSSAGIGAGIAAGARVVAVRAGNFLDQDQSAAHRIVDTLDELTLEFAANLWT